MVCVYAHVCVRQKAFPSLTSNIDTWQEPSSICGSPLGEHSPVLCCAAAAVRSDCLANTQRQFMQQICSPLFIIIIIIIMQDEQRTMGSASIQHNIQRWEIKS